MKYKSLHSEYLQTSESRGHGRAPYCRRKRPYEATNKCLQPHYLLPTPSREWGSSQNSVPAKAPESPSPTTNAPTIKWKGFRSRRESTPSQRSSSHCVWSSEVLTSSWSAVRFSLRACQQNLSVQWGQFFERLAYLLGLNFTEIIGFMLVLLIAQDHWAIWLCFKCCNCQHV